MRTLIDKIYYIRWNQPFDDRYFRIGSLPKVTMGYGSLVNSYSNSMDYPSIRRTGFDLRFTFGNFGLDFIHSDFKEFDAPALLGLGTRFEFIENLDLSFIMVTDQNQYNGLLDSDGDHYPDYVEPDYADDPDRWHDNQFITEFLLNSDCVAVICIDLINNADESETPDGICDNCDDLNSDAICDNDLNEILKAKKYFEIIIQKYPNTEFALDSEYKLELIQELLASKEMYLARYYVEREKWIPAINRFKTVVKDYDTTIYTEEALHRLVELHYKIGLIDESKKYAVLLGYNYQSSQWYAETYRILNKDYVKISERKNKNNKESILKKFKDLLK